MEEEKLLLEYEFIRKQIYESSSLICENKYLEASFKLGTLYAETRIICEKLRSKTQKES